MRPRKVVSHLRAIFDRRTKLSLIFAAVVAAALALMETVAVVSVLPLVSLVSGTSIDQSGVRWLADLVGTDDSDTMAAVLAALVVGTFVAKDVLSLWSIWWQTGFIARQRIVTSVTMMRGFMQASLVDHRARSTAELLRTMNDAVQHVFSLVVSGILQLVTAGLTIAAITVALIVVSPLATLSVMGLFAAVVTLYARFVRGRVLQAGDDVARASVKAYLASLNGLGAFKEVRLRHSEEYFISKYAIAASDGALAGRRANFFSAIPKYILEIVFILAIGLMVLLDYARGGTTGILGMLALFVAAGFRLLPNVSAAIGALNSIRFGSASLEIVAAEQAISGNFGPRRPPERRLSFEHELTLEHVSFTYPGSVRPALDDVTFRIPRGTSLALVGGSGGGKTTLVDIVLGLLQPTSGSVKVDGRDIKEDMASWQVSTSMVAQDVYFTGWTLADNIAFDQDRHDIDRAGLDRAVRRAELDDVIEDLPEGLDTMLGERGSRLSGGQRQRVGIARALYREPALLVLDEATSALDNDTERRITHAIDALAGSVTVIVVAHRLSTVRNVDQVIYLEGGMVSDMGTFDDLIERSTGFARLVQLGDLRRPSTAGGA